MFTFFLPAGCFDLHGCTESQLEASIRGVLQVSVKEIRNIAFLDTKLGTQQLTTLAQHGSLPPFYSDYKCAISIATRASTHRPGVPIGR